MTSAAPIAQRRGLGRRFASAAWRGLRAALLGLVVIIIFAEEWGWRPLTALAGAIARFPPIAVLEALIRRAPPRLALLFFVVPAIALIPVKLGALWLIQEGRTTLGITLIIVAKILGTAFVGRLFILVEPQLMTFPWFAHGIAWWRATRDRIMATLRASFLWRSGRVMRRAWGKGVRRLMTVFR